MIGNRTPIKLRKTLPKSQPTPVLRYLVNVLFTDKVPWCKTWRISELPRQVRADAHWRVCRSCDFLVSTNRRDLRLRDSERPRLASPRAPTVLARFGAATASGAPYTALVVLGAWAFVCASGGSVVLIFDILVELPLSVFAMDKLI